MRMTVSVRICGGLLGGLLLFGCSSTPKPTEPATDIARAAAAARGYKVGKPYQIKGIWYYPEVDYDYVEEGVASWYGPGFHGKQTANGEIYDQNDMTAAHRTLPLPSIVRVTNLENGRSIKLKVNDRGPFARERIIDVSRRASQLLGFHSQGTTPVRVEIVEDESRQLAAALGVPSEVAWAASQPAPVIGATAAQPVLVPEALPEPAPAAEPPTAPAYAAYAAYAAPYTPEPPSAVSYTAESLPPLGGVSDGALPRWVQAGAFADPERAADVRRRLADIGPTVASRSVIGGRELVRVRVGPVQSEAEAQRILASVSEAGFPDSRIVAD
ncbi:MAG TPA: septal ring lytic transglycosylase RlpA family protein [Rhodospirillales bacterium]|nr:septal ring lytic transglycosylase RlpA family protein [Rhodospirillales bacterium]